MVKFSNQDFFGVEAEFFDGDGHLMCVVRDRHEHLMRLSRLCLGGIKDFVVSAKDICEGAEYKFTRHQSYFSKYKVGDKDFSWTDAFDLHRQIFPNEVVVESDYARYEDNVVAARFVGRLLEERGFVPHYYYSGGKSVHIHVFLCPERIKGAGEGFVRWLRGLCVSAFGFGDFVFDRQLVSGSHLIRAVMSRNGGGYKTFLGYSWKDVPPVPYVCNPETRIYPLCGDIILTKGLDWEELFLSYKDYLVASRALEARRSKEFAIFLRDNPDYYKKVRPQVARLMGEEFVNGEDGFRRACFILSNELKRVYGVDKALVLLREWNDRLGGRFRVGELSSMVRSQHYFLSDAYIDAFLREIGII